MRHCFPYLSFHWFSYFNSRTHVECGVSCHYCSGNPNISTHALTWSAASPSFLSRFPLGGFQLTHSRGVRPLRIIPVLHRYHFNSRTHVECGVKCPSSGLEKIISTHALTWSAAVGQFKRHSYYIFQLTHSRGVRLSCTFGDGVLEEFQLTHSRGVRLDQIPTVDEMEHFNSRTHVECGGVYKIWLPTFSDFNSRTHVECG